MLYRGDGWSRGGEMYLCDMADDVFDIFSISTRSEAPFVYKLSLLHAYIEDRNIEKQLHASSNTADYGMAEVLRIATLSLVAKQLKPLILEHDSRSAAQETSRAD